MFLGAQKNHLIETVLLSTHNICFGGEIRKLFSCYALLSKGLIICNYSLFQKSAFKSIKNTKPPLCYMIPRENPTVSDYTVQGFTTYLKGAFDDLKVGTTCTCTLDP